MKLIVALAVLAVLVWAAVPFVPKKPVAAPEIPQGVFCVEMPADMGAVCKRKVGQ